MSGAFFPGWVGHLAELRTLSYVAEPAARALALALVAALALIRTKDASLKFLVWKGVLAAALAMPLLGWAVPALPVILPHPAWLPTATKSLAENPARTLAAESPDGRRSPKLVGAGLRLAPPTPSTNTASFSRPVLKADGAAVGLDSDKTRAAQKREFSWWLFAVVVYLLVAVLLLVRLAIGWFLGRKLLRSAAEVNDPGRLTLLAEEGRSLGLVIPPALKTSESAAVPVTLGVLVPVIVLPATSAAWDERKWRAVLAHELSHVAQRDALTFMVSQVHRGLFWFSPLAWWLDRKLRALAEQASDDWAVERTEDRVYYAELLLGFLKDLNGAPMRIRFEGASMAKEIRMNERVERILSARRNFSRRMNNSLAVGAALVALPAVYFAAALKPAIAPQQPSPPAAAVAPARPVAPSAATAPAKPPRGVFGVEQMPPPGTAPISPEPALAPAPPCGGIVAPAIAVPPMARVPIPPELGMVQSPALPPQPSLAPVAPLGPSAPTGPCPAVAPSPMAGTPAVAMMPVPSQEAVAPKPPPPSREKPFWWTSGDSEDNEEGEHYVIVSGDSISMSGSSDDAHRAKALRSKINGDYIWFHPDEMEYVITDPKTVEQAKALFAPQEELGRKQEELGKLQEELGAQQEELAKHMEEVRVKLPDLRKELKGLEERLSNVDEPRTMEQLSELQAELGEMQARIGERMSEAGGMQGEFGAKQGALGAKQGELGRRQGELGREQGRLAREASRKMRHILDDSVSSGLAKPAPK